MINTYFSEKNLNDNTLKTIGLWEKKKKKLIVIEQSRGFKKQKLKQNQ